MTKNKIEYLIVFKWQTTTSSGIGNKSILCSKKLSTLEHIRETEQILLKENPEWTAVVITNFIKFN